MMMRVAGKGKKTKEVKKSREASSEKKIPSPLEVEGAQDVPNANNVRYILHNRWSLTLLVDIYETERLTQIAVANGAAIGDLPVQLNLSVWALKKMGVGKSSQSLSGLSTELVDAGKNVKWMLGGRLLKMVIDLSEGPECSASAEPGRYTSLASMKQSSKLGESNYRVTVDLLCEGGNKWPVFGTPESTCNTSGDSSPTSIVPRALKFSLSPVTTREASASLDQSVLMQLNEFTTLDTSRFPVVKLCLSMEGEKGRIVHFAERIFSGIGVSVDVRCLSDEELSPEARREPGTGVNITAFEEHDSEGREYLFIELDSSKDYGAVGDDERIISNASHVRVGSRYLLNFTATRPAPRLPDFAEVYRSVRDHLHQLPNALNNLNMPSVRAAVVKDLVQHVASRELKNMIWEAVRLYIIRDYLEADQRSISTSPIVIRTL